MEFFWSRIETENQLNPGTYTEYRNIYEILLELYMFKLYNVTVLEMYFIN